MIPCINRTVIIIWHTEAYSKWTESLDGECPGSDEGNVYLMENVENDTREEARLFLRKYWREIAEEEFTAWWTDDNGWLKLLNIKDFEKFFRWEVRDMVHNFSNEAIQYEDEELPGGTGVDPTLN